MGRTDRGARGAFLDAPSIEFLTPRVELFDATADAAAGPSDVPVEAFADADDTPRASRTTTVLAGLGLLGLVAVGVIAAAPWEGDDASATPSTPVPPTTVAASTASTPETSVAMVEPAVGEPDEPASEPSAVALDPALPTSGHLLDPALLPSGWRATGGLSPMLSATDPDATASANVPMWATTPRAPNGWLELWAAPGSARTTGPWFAVQWSPEPQRFARADAARIAVGNRIGMMTTTADGVSSLSFPVARATATITWFGWDRDAIVDIADDLRFARGGRPRFDTWFTPDLGGQHVRVLSRSSFGTSLEDDYFMTDVVSSAHYEHLDATGERRFVDITTRLADPQLDELLAPFVHGPPTVWKGAVPGRPVDAATMYAADLRFATPAAPHDLHLLQWTAGGVVVQLTTTTPIEDLLATFPVGSVGPGTVGTWQVQQQAALNAGPGRMRTELASGTVPDGGVWQISIAPEVGWVDAFLTSADRSRGVVVQMDLDIRPCGTAASVTSTVVFCLRPAHLGPATLRVDGEAGAFEVPFAPLGADGEWLGVVHQFDGIGGFRADIIGPNGATTPGISAGLPATVADG